MQKLGSENINTPWDASQVPCNCGLWLNREETLSATSKKTFYNNPEENLQTWVCLGLKPFKLPTIQRGESAIPPTIKAVGILARVR
jgi:hypothetical protein